MKVLSIIITVFLFCSPISAETVFPPADGSKREESMNTFFLKDMMFLYSIPSFSLVSEEDDQESPDEGKESGGKAGKVFSHITFTYILPVSYFALSLILKEFVYTGAREDNPLVYVNPVVSSVTTFGATGFFAGLFLGLIFSNDKGFIDTFAYSAILGVVLGLTGMLAGGIYAMLEYDSIIANDLFYYGGPVLVLFIPVFDIIRIISED